MRCIGWSFARKSWVSAGCMGVFTTLGETAFTRMPLSAYSMASARVTASRPPLVNEAIAAGAGDGQHIRVVAGRDRPRIGDDPKALPAETLDEAGSDALRCARHDRDLLFLAHGMSHLIRFLRGQRLPCRRRAPRRRCRL